MRIFIEAETEMYERNGWECHRLTGRLTIQIELVDRENVDGTRW